MSRSLSMPEHNILMEKVGHVKGKDVNGNIVTLERTHPRQLALFQTFVSDEDRYSNTIELYDAVPKYFSNPKLMASLRKDGKFLLALKREFEHKGERYTLYIRPARIIYTQNRHHVVITPVKSVYNATMATIVRP